MSDSSHCGMSSDPVFNFTIIGETPDFLVVNKPPGLLMHPTKPGGPPTLWDGIKQLLLYEIATGRQPGLVNRLDRETSGLVLVAKNSRASARAGRLLMERRMEKTYLALCQGWPSSDSFTVCEPIIRLGEVMPSPVHLRRGVHPDGQPAETAFTVLERRKDPTGAPFSLVQASPRTGRTHQIRVHLAHLGHPILGDKLYTGDGSLYLEFIRTGFTPALAAQLGRPFHALHASELSFPDEETLLHFQVPPPPHFFQPPAT